jgi:hypothetical protein
MSVRAIVVTVCLVTLLPGVAAAQSIGGGIEIGPLLVEARWSEGLTNILVEATSPAGTELKARTLLVLGGIRR